MIKSHNLSGYSSKILHSQSFTVLPTLRSFLQLQLVKGKREREEEERKLYFLEEEEEEEEKYFSRKFISTCTSITAAE